MNTSGFFMAMRSRFERNRLGELLVQRGTLTPDQLRIALKTQKESKQHLGHVLQDLHFASKLDIRRTLVEQATYRALAAAFTLFIGVSSLTGGAKASPFNNVKPSASNQAMVYKAAYHPQSQSRMTAMKKSPSAYPNLFGSKEVVSRDISAFKKWTDVLGKIDGISFQQSQMQQFQNLETTAQISAVNEYVNQVTYIEDKNNYGKSDYWATPSEFFARGGDCEDFAIAKYAMLRSLGISEDRMRLAIVQDTIKDIPHAVLIVYTDSGAMVLDNQVQTAKQMASVTRYKPIYSINASGWWRHVT